jgi:excisionase family DNA binding protein
MQTNPPAKMFLTTDEAAALWGISRWTIFDLVRKGKLRPITNLGKGWKWQVSDINPVVERL